MYSLEGKREIKPPITGERKQTNKTHQHIKEPILHLLATSFHIVIKDSILAKLKIFVLCFKFHLWFHWRVFINFLTRSPVMRCYDFFCQLLIPEVAVLPTLE